jgi:peroxiredoxin
MNPDPQNVSAPQPTPSRGLAIASLILGVIGFCLSLFLFGALLGAVGLALGLVHILRKRGPNGMAWCGVILSALSVIAAIGMGFAYFKVFKTVKESMAEAMQYTPGPAAQWQGVFAPDLTVTNLEGKAIRLADLKGKRIVFNFWATWCPPCVKEIPEFVRLQNETSRDELVVIGVSEESADVLKPFVKTNGVNYSIVSATDLPAPFKSLQGVPTTFFIDRKGVIQSVIAGPRSYADLKQLALAKDFEGVAKTEPPASDLKDAGKRPTK